MTARASNPAGGRGHATDRLRPRQIVNTRLVAPREETELESFGAVVILDRDFRIVSASSSSGALLHLEATELVGEPLQRILGAEDVADLRAAVAESLQAVGWRRVWLGGFQQRVKLHAFDAGDDLLGLDILPLPTERPGTDAQAVERVAGWTERLFACQSVDELLGVAAKVTRERTHYGGAWVTRLEPAGDAVIVATDQHGSATRVGQRIPASDLPPAQPQVMGRYVPFFVADIAAAPAHLEPSVPGVQLQGSALLRPYPRYLAQLHGIGVGALASVPIVVDGRLWGRISSANGDARRLTAAVQAELSLIGAAVGTHLTELIELEASRERVGLAQCAHRVVRAVAATSDLVEGLARDADALCGVCDAASAVIVIGGRTATVGEPLGEAAIAQLVEVARADLDAAASTSTSTTSFVAPVAPAEVAGYVAVRLAADSGDVILWTRGEARSRVTWLSQEGPEDEPTEMGDGVSTRTEELRGHSAPWTEAQLRQAEELRDAIGEVLVSRYGQMQHLANELQRSNEEYDAFAHAAAHDLKTPLRGMRLATEFLMEDTQDRLSAEELEEFRTVLRLADRMNGMLDDLLAYARTGRDAWDPEPVDVQRAAREAVELLGAAAQDATVVAEATTFVTDAVALQQLLLNLIGNAVKYSDGPATVDITVTTLAEASRSMAPPASLSAAPPGTPVLAVTDRGRGIDPAHHAKVFELFRQLDPSADGSGTGLALCRLICRRHGGDIWVDSERGRGSTFYLTTGDSERGRAGL